jgi:hypothetical protein
MGLYLCIFDDRDEELEGVEIGSYTDFDFLRNAVITTVENGVAGSVCPTLQNHADNDGEWTSEESKQLLVELEHIEAEMNKFPPVELNSEWKTQVAKLLGLTPKTLAECFFDVDGEPLFARLKKLAIVSIESGHSILFQ